MATVASSDDGSAVRPSDSISAPTVSAYAVVRLSNPFSGRPCSQMPASDESVCAAVRRHTRKVYTVILPFLSV